jgi:hypothetical protein
LSFSLLLPSSFEYYQTQRTSGISYVDLEIFVPTADLRFGKQVQGYATPIVIRVFDKAAWDEVSQGEGNKYKYLGEKKDKVYTVAFWDLEPSDWQDKWDEEVKEFIINNFEIE